MINVEFGVCSSSSNPTDKTEQEIRELSDTLFKLLTTLDLNINGIIVKPINCGYIIPSEGFKKRHLP